MYGSCIGLLFRRSFYVVINDFNELHFLIHSPIDLQKSHKNHPAWESL